jgi:uncharacterized protein YjbI with pentapeptide repeats
MVTTINFASIGATEAYGYAVNFRDEGEFSKAIACLGVAILRDSDGSAVAGQNVENKVCKFFEKSRLADMVFLAFPLILIFLRENGVEMQIHSFLANMAQLKIRKKKGRLIISDYRKNLPVQADPKDYPYNVELRKLLTYYSPRFAYNFFSYCLLNRIIEPASYEKLMGLHTSIGGCRENADNYELFKFYLDEAKYEDAYIYSDRIKDTFSPLPKDQDLFFYHKFIIELKKGNQKKALSYLNRVSSTFNKYRTEDMREAIEADEKAGKCEARAAEPAVAATPDKGKQSVSEKAYHSTLLFSYEVFEKLYAANHYAGAFLFIKEVNGFLSMHASQPPGVAHLGKTLRAPASTSLDSATVFPSAAAVLSAPTTGFANDLTPLDAATAGSAARASHFPAFSEDEKDYEGFIFRKKILFQMRRVYDFHLQQGGTSDQDLEGKLKIRFDEYYAFSTAMKYAIRGGLAIISDVINHPLRNTPDGKAFRVFINGLMIIKKRLEHNKEKIQSLPDDEYKKLADGLILLIREYRTLFSQQEYDLIYQPVIDIIEKAKSSYVFPMESKDDLEEKTKLFLEAIENNFREKVDPVLIIESWQASGTMEEWRKRADQNPLYAIAYALTTRDVMSINQVLLGESHFDIKNQYSAIFSHCKRMCHFINDERESTGETLDLRHLNLSGITHENKDQFTGRNLNDAKLAGANLSRTDLTATTLVGADLSNADLSDVFGLSVNMSGANLSGTNLSGADLRSVDLTNANILESKARGAAFFSSQVPRMGDETTDDGGYRETLRLLQKDIMSCREWEVSKGGGVVVTIDNVEKRVTNHAHKILASIQKLLKDKNLHKDWKREVEEVYGILKASQQQNIVKRTLSFFGIGERAQSTQKIYDYYKRCLAERHPELQQQEMTASASG